MFKQRGMRTISSTSRLPGTGFGYRSTAKPFVIPDKIKIKKRVQLSSSRTRDGYGVETGVWIACLLPSGPEQTSCSWVCGKSVLGSYSSRV